MHKFEIIVYNATNRLITDVEEFIDNNQYCDVEYECTFDDLSWCIDISPIYSIDDDFFDLCKELLKHLRELGYVL